MKKRSKGIIKLEKLIEALELSQQDVCNRIGITPGALSHYLSGRRTKVDPLIALKISSIFQIPMEDFYRYE